MAYVNFNRSSSLSQAKTSQNADTIFFPTNSSAIVMDGKEYGGVTTTDLNSAIDTVEQDVDGINDKVDLIRGEVQSAQLAIGAVQTDGAPTENSTNHLTSGAIYTAFENYSEKEVELLTDPVSIKPNVLYKLGDRSSLTVSFIQGQSGHVNEYMFEFNCTSDLFTLTLPSGVVWIEEPDFMDGYTYQVSVLNNLAITAGWEVENE